MLTIPFYFQHLHSTIQISKLSSNIGIRQGENFSPVLFSLFLNDIHVIDCLSHSYDGLSNVYNAANISLDNDELDVYI